MDKPKNKKHGTIECIEEGIFCVDGALVDLNDFQNVYLNLLLSGTEIEFVNALKHQ